MRKQPEENPPYCIIHKNIGLEGLKPGGVYLLTPFNLISKSDSAIIVVFIGRKNDENYTFSTYGVDGRYCEDQVYHLLRLCDHVISEIEADDGFLQGTPHISLKDGPFGLADRIRWIKDGCPKLDNP